MTRISLTLSEFGRNYFPKQRAVTTFAAGAAVTILGVKFFSKSYKAPKENFFQPLTISLECLSGGIDKQKLKSVLSSITQWYSGGITREKKVTSLSPKENKLSLYLKSKVSVGNLNEGEHYIFAIIPELVLNAVTKKCTVKLQDNGTELTGVFDCYEDSPLKASELDNLPNNYDLFDKENLNMHIKDSLDDWEALHTTLNTLKKSNTVHLTITVADSTTLGAFFENIKEFIEDDKKAKIEYLKVIVTSASVENISNLKQIEFPFSIPFSIFDSSGGLIHSNHEKITLDFLKDFTMAFQDILFYRSIEKAHVRFQQVEEGEVWDDKKFDKGCEGFQTLKNTFNDQFGQVWLEKQKLKIKKLLLKLSNNSGKILVASLPKLLNYKIARFILQPNCVEFNPSIILEKQNTMKINYLTINEVNGGYMELNIEVMQTFHDLKQYLPYVSTIPSLLGAKAFDKSSLNELFSGTKIGR